MTRETPVFFSISLLFFPLSQTGLMGFLGQIFGVPCLLLNEPWKLYETLRNYNFFKMTKFQVVHVKLSKVHERRAKWMAKILFRCLRILTDVMRTFLSYHGLMNSTSIKVQDSQGFLYAIKNRVHLSNFLNANGKTKTQIKRIILNAIKGRNATCHTNFTIFDHRHTFRQFRHTFWPFRHKFWPFRHTFWPDF